MFCNQMFCNQMFCNEIFSNQMVINQPGMSKSKAPVKSFVNIQTGVLVLFSLPISEPFCEPDLQRKAKSRVVFGVLRAVPDNSLTFCADPRKLSLVAPRQLLLLKLIQLR